MKFPQCRILTRMITYQMIIKQGIDQNRSTCEQLLEECIAGEKFWHCRLIMEQSTFVNIKRKHFEMHPLKADNVW